MYTCTHQENVDVKQLALVFEGVIEDFHIQADERCRSCRGEGSTLPQAQTVPAQPIGQKVQE